MKIKYILLSLTIVCCCAFSVRSFADIPDQKTNLVGLVSVCVIVEDLPKDLADNKQSLRKDQLQADVELLLRQSGIHVITLVDNLTKSNSTLLDISISAFKHDTGSVFSYSILVDAYCSATIDFSHKTRLLAIWESGLYGTVPELAIDAIRGYVKDKISLFCNDFLTANPKSDPVPAK
jgi:hypothetical protein